VEPSRAGIAVGAQGVGHTVTVAELAAHTPGSSARDAPGIGTYRAGFRR